MTSTLRRITRVALRPESAVGRMSSHLCSLAAPVGQYAHFPSTTVIGERVAAPSVIGVTCFGSPQRYSIIGSLIPGLLPTVLPAWLALRLRRFWRLAGQRTVNERPRPALREITGLHAWRDDFFPALRIGQGVLRLVPTPRKRPIAMSLRGTAGVTACHSCGRLTVSAGQKHHRPSCLVTRPCDRGSVRWALATQIRPIIKRGGMPKKRAAHARVRGGPQLQLRRDCGHGRRWRRQPCELGDAVHRPAADCSLRNGMTTAESAGALPIV